MEVKNILRVGDQLLKSPKSAKQDPSIDFTLPIVTSHDSADIKSPVSTSKGHSLYRFKATGSIFEGDIKRDF